METPGEGGAADEALEAAWIALLALRATIHRSQSLRPGLVRLLPDRATVYQDAEAAAHFAAAPKPMLCHAVVSQGLLGVEVAALASDERYRFTHEHMLAADVRHNGGFMQSLARSAGRPANAVAVLCAGRGETRLTTLAALQRWRRDYHIRGLGFAGDSVTNELARDQPAYREARSRGAAGVLRLGR